MPLFTRKEIDSKASLILWEINEKEDDLLSQITLHPSDSERFKRFTHENKRKEFLALRCCLSEYFGENPEVFYTEDGKPYLKNDHFVSFSHSRQYAGIIVSKSVEVGLDLELYREGILRIAHKFMRPEEDASLAEETKIEHITYYWGAKEVMVKITGDRKHNFLTELSVKPFDYSNCVQSTGFISAKNYRKQVCLFFEKKDDLFITYGWEQT